MNDTDTAVADAYRSFARLEARGRSAAYESLAESVADDPAVVGFIASLPADKRQPNLLFAAARCPAELESASSVQGAGPAQMPPLAV